MHCLPFSAKKLFDNHPSAVRHELQICWEMCWNTDGTKHVMSALSYETDRQVSWLDEDEFVASHPHPQGTPFFWEEPFA